MKGVLVASILAGGREADGSAASTKRRLGVPRNRPDLLGRTA